MSSWVIPFVTAFLASLMLTPLARSLARRRGIVDHPDGQRKLHARPVPLWGGIAVYLAIVIGLLVAGSHWVGAMHGRGELTTTLIVMAGVVCFVGCIDDSWVLRARVKLLLQIGSVLPIVMFGCYMDRIVLFGYPFQLGWLGIPLTIVWLVGCINALNLLDGMDGLASTVGFLAAVMLAIIAATLGNPQVSVIAVVLAGALAGFLVYNLPPASIFLGDSGSMVIGLVLGVLGIQGAMKTTTTLAITIPAVVLSLPMFDMTLAVVRRKLSGRQFDTADRQHVHHRLLDRGLSQWQALCIIGAFCLVTGAAATIATIFRSDALAWITALTLVVLMIRLRVFGHHEAAMVINGAVRRMAAFARRLDDTAPRHDLPGPNELARLDFQQAWDILVDAIQSHDVGRLELTLVRPGVGPRRHTWHDTTAKLDENHGWSTTVAWRDPQQGLCELRASGGNVFAHEPSRSASVTSCLSAFVPHFLARAGEIPVPAPEVIEPPARAA